MTVCPKALPHSLTTPCVTDSSLPRGEQQIESSDSESLLWVITDEICWSYLLFLLDLTINLLFFFLLFVCFEEYS